MSQDLAPLQLFINSSVALFLLSIRSGNRLSNRILAFYFIIFHLPTIATVVSVMKTLVTSNLL